MVFLACIVVIGMGIAFLGLAYHHHRRLHEMYRLNGRHTGQVRASP